MSKDTNTNRGIFMLCLILGCITSLSIDIYIPALSHIARDMQISQSGAQFIVSIFIFGFAVTQLIFGFLSDFYGRKKMLIYGLAIYCSATIGALFIGDSVFLLYAARFFQGIGACSAAISAYAIIRDLYSGNESTKILSYLYTTMVIVSSAAPILGGFIVSYLHWKHSFIFLIMLGILTLIYTIKTPFSADIQLKNQRFFLPYAGNM